MIEEINLFLKYLNTKNYSKNTIKSYGKDLELFSAFSKKGTYNFICPEIINEENYDFQADIYSLGLTMLWLMSYRNPTKIFKNKETQKAIKREIRIEYLLNYYNEYLRSLVLRMIDDNNYIRPSAAKALEELNLIEKYIENPEGNISIKLQLDLKNNLGTNLFYISNFEIISYLQRIIIYGKIIEY